MVSYYIFNVWIDCIIFHLLHRSHNNNLNDRPTRKVVHELEQLRKDRVNDNVVLLNNK